jgi:hypothetical protein
VFRDAEKQWPLQTAINKPKSKLVVKQIHGAKINALWNADHIFLSAQNTAA